MIMPMAMPILNSAVTTGTGQVTVGDSTFVRGYSSLTDPETGSYVDSDLVKVGDVAATVVRVRNDIFEIEFQSEGERDSALVYLKDNFSVIRAVDGSGTVEWRAFTSSFQTGQTVRTSISTDSISPVFLQGDVGNTYTVEWA